MSLTAVETLLAIEEIKKMRARFARTLDTKAWDEFADCWTPDGTLTDYTAGPDNPGIAKGVPEILKLVRGGLDTGSSVHHLHGPEIEILSATTATGIWAMEDKLRWPPGANAITELHGCGHYHETYEKLDGAWKVKSFKLTRLRVDVK